MRLTLLAMSLLLGVLAIAGIGCAVISPSDMAAWTISEISTILTIMFVYYYTCSRT